MLNANVLLTDEAVAQLHAITSKADGLAVQHALASFRDVSEAYPLYDPRYKAAHPPFACRVCYAGHFGIYFICESNRVVVFAIIDNRLDPERHFQDIDDIELLESLLFGHKDA